MRKPHVSNLAVGTTGEEAALAFLTARGYVLLHRNFRVPTGEIDLVLEKGAELIFVEVKTRRGRSHGHPSEAVGWRKQRRIVRTALWYAQQNGMLDRNMRFDVVSVMLAPDGSCSIEHIVSAFDAE